VIDREVLLKDSKKLVGNLVDDLRQRTDDVAEIRVAVRGQYDDARAAGRTDRSYEEWREDLLAQVAVGWVLGTVFVRFCEDNRLYDTPLLSGPGARRDLAGDHRANWLAENPAAGDREWLEEVFGRYRRIPAMAQLFGERNPLWQFGPSADGARAIIELWRRLDPASGDLRHDFTDPDSDTRFLGDLYQDLSDHAKDTYALLQTPDFVESFILDRTLDPAIEAFGLDDFRMIDPTCGSGHFLLGAFHRILRRWLNREPGTPIRDLVRRALDAVNGVDLNPFAVEITRFRLLVAALQASQLADIADAPAFEMNVAVGDSLIHGRISGELMAGADVMSAALRHRYPAEDEDLARSLLDGGRYHAVVGNPPYINAKDPALSDVYRSLYSTCHRQYSLGVPFTERFFDLAVSGNGDHPGGFVGMITTNTFMKREFGKKLVEDWLPRRDVTHIIDTSGAYIPGHGTPTVILFARHQRPESGMIRTVRGIRGEPGRPPDPARGEVWTSIVSMVDTESEENAFVSVEDADRARFSVHPWSLQGGVSPEVVAEMEVSSQIRLGLLTALIGYTGQTNADPVFVADDGAHERFDVESTVVRRLIKGDAVRDWYIHPGEQTIFPYEVESRRLVAVESFPGLHGRMWAYRVALGARRTFNKMSYAEEGRPWWEWHQVALDRVPGPAITFAFVATHNHFVLDRGGKVFNRSAPIIKLPSGATEDDHLKLLGLLNSSPACFWMKQVFHSKGEGGGARVDAGYSAMGDEPWKSHYEFDGTKLQQFPIPAGAPLGRAREMDELAQRLFGTLPAAVIDEAPPTRDRLAQARERVDAIRARMVAVQEELDWECYPLYGLTDEELTAPPEQVPDLNKGERAFEIALARKLAAGEVESTWFTRHGSTPITELPARWPEPYRRVVERRIALIESGRSIRLLERPEYKRRWNWESWEDLQEEALRGWLLDRLEARELWADIELMTTARLADRVRRSQEFVEAARLYAGRVDIDLTELITSLVLAEAVPFAVAYRFNASGLRRRREWEQVWELQRQEDAIDARTQLPEDNPQHLPAAEAKALKAEQGLDRIPVPPKYRKTDYADEVSYRLRGSLDVPQERFVRYPGTRKGADTTPVIGWAGWDHLEQARALAGHYAARKDQGAETSELVALLAGLQELVPWLRQWHNEVDPEYGQRMGDFFASFVATEARGYGTTLEDLKTWTPE
jgi:hypothetical protein